MFWGRQRAQASVGGRINLYLLGIDIGTTGTKVVLINEEGKVVGSTTEEYPLYTPQPGWAEQNTEDWWRATKAAIRAILFQSRIHPRDIKGIGLSGQMHGAVLLGKNHEVLRPPILWCDQRTAAECQWITEKAGNELKEITCNPALTGFTAPKVVWVRRHEPEVYHKIDKILLPKDYIRFRLTGVFATEVSDASGTLFLDVKKRKWSEEILSLLEIPMKQMPEVYESPIPSGEITKEAARETGLHPGTPVVGGGGDQAAGAVGTGVVKSGIISSTIGTSGVVFAFTDEVKIDALQRVHSFCHAVPGKWHIMGVMLSAGGSFQWFRNQLGGLERELARILEIDPYEILTQEANRAPVGSEGLIFLPYLMGERTPHANPNARGGWIGLTMRHTKSHLARAIMEGVTYGLRDSLEIIKELGTPTQQIRASGGGGKSSLWRQIQADIFGCEIVTINATEGPAFGVALLAGVGTGIYSTVEEACEKTIKITSHTQPIEKNVHLYEEYYRIYRSLYPPLKPVFDALSRMVING